MIKMIFLIFFLSFNSFSSDKRSLYEFYSFINSDKSKLNLNNDIKVYKKGNNVFLNAKVTNVLDGDTIIIGDLLNIRLYGIDAPEKEQLCFNKNGNKYNCGIISRDYLKKIIGKNKIFCRYIGDGKYYRILLSCKNKNYDLSKQMVKSGWAVKYFSNKYKNDEEYAKSNKLGIWQGKFERPETWRKKNYSFN